MGSENLSAFRILQLEIVKSVEADVGLIPRHLWIQDRPLIPPLHGYHTDASCLDQTEQHRLNILL